MKSYALFQEYIWLVNTIHNAGKITLEEINRRWLETETSGGLPIARSTFNRHRDAILDMFGIIIECDKKDDSAITSTIPMCWRRIPSRTGCSPRCL